MMLSEVLWMSKERTPVLPAAPVVITEWKGTAVRLVTGEPRGGDVFTSRLS